MAGLGNRHVREALASLASRSEPPAAGVATAFACAAAAALVELTAGLAAERMAAEGRRDQADGAARMRALAARAAELRERLISLGDEDVRAYAAVMKASDEAARALALSEASETPLAVAQSAAEVAEAAAETARAGAWAFSADAVVASELAAAAAVGSADLVTVNLGEGSQDSRTGCARAAADRARSASEAAAAQVQGYGPAEAM